MSIMRRISNRWMPCSVRPDGPLAATGRAESMMEPSTRRTPGRSACPKFWPGCSPTGSKLASAAQTCSPCAQACYGSRVSDTSDIIELICAEHAGREGPLLPILHAVQAAFACVDEAAERVIAKALNQIGRAHV